MSACGFVYIVQLPLQARGDCESFSVGPGTKLPSSKEQNVPSTTVLCLPPSHVLQTVSYPEVYLGYLRVIAKYIKTKMVNVKS